MAVCVASISFFLGNREKGPMEPFKVGRLPMSGFLIYLLVYIIVVGALAASTYHQSPTVPGFLIGLGIGVAAHDIGLLIRSFRAGG